MPRALTSGLCKIGVRAAISSLAIVLILSGLAVVAVVRLAGTSQPVESGARAALPAPTTKTIVTAGVGAAHAPSANIAESPSYPSACQSAPGGATCENDAIAALNNGRAALGLGPYDLPLGFTALSQTSQLIVLSNLDRIAYGLAPIMGDTVVLNQRAQAGVTGDTDPSGLLGTSGGLFYQQWTANWAVGWASAPYTYYEWMYNDGPGSGNIDCTTTDTSGCWGHRADTLANFGGQVAMGIGTGTSPKYNATAYTELYEAVTSGTPGYVPVVTGVAQERASTTVDVTGLGLQGATAVSIGGLSASFSVNSSTSLNVLDPSSAASTITVTTSGGTSAPMATPALLSASAAAGGSYAPLTPARLLDTRTSHAVAPGAMISLPVAGHGGVPASGASAVVLNVTVTGTREAGFITVWPAGTVQPGTSNLNFARSQTVPNLVMVPLGTGGAVDLRNASAGTSELVVDVFGYYLSGTPASAGAFVSVAPNRILDTRSGVGAAPARVAAGHTIAVPVAGVGGVPSSGVAAVVVNVTVAGPAMSGYVTVWADGASRPGTSNLNFGAGKTVPNLVVAPVGSDGSIDLYNGSAGPLDLVADVSGYFLGGSSVAGATLHALDPYRLLDTRNATGAPAVALARGATVRLQVGGRGNVATGDVCAVVLNVTAVGLASGGYVTVWADGTGRPATSNLNFGARQVVPNLVVAPVGALGVVDLYAGGPLQLVADVVGYLSCSSG